MHIYTHILSNTSTQYSGRCKQSELKEHNNNNAACAEHTTGIVNEVLQKMSRNSFEGRIFFILLSTFLHLTCGIQDQGRTVITQNPSPFIFHDNTSVVLTCHTASPSIPGIKFIWEIYPSKLLVCAEWDNTSRNTCTYRPLLEDAEKAVNCIVLSGNTVGRGSTLPLYYYPPQSSPSISIDTLRINTNVASATLGPGTVIKCEVRGGRPLVSSIVLTCDSPHHKERADEVGPESVASYVTLTNLQDEDGNITCTCSATWEPRPDLYQINTTESFQIKDTKTYPSPSTSDSALSVTAAVVTAVPLSAIVVIVVIIVIIKRRRCNSGRPEFYGSSQEAGSAQEVYSTLGSRPARCQPGDNDLYDHCSTVFLTGHK